MLFFWHSCMLLFYIIRVSADSQRYIWSLVFSHLIEYHIFGSLNDDTCYYKHFTWFDTFYEATRRLSFIFVTYQTIYFLKGIKRHPNTKIHPVYRIYACSFLQAFINSGVFDKLFISVYRHDLGLLTGKTLTLTF